MKVIFDTSVLVSSLVSDLKNHEAKLLIERTSLE